MWLITYSQAERNKHPVMANAVLRCNPAIWLAGAIAKYPDVETKLLFAIEVPDDDGAYLQGML